VVDVLDQRSDLEATRQEQQHVGYECMQRLVVVAVQRRLAGRVLRGQDDRQRFLDLVDAELGDEAMSVGADQLVVQRLVVGEQGAVPDAGAKVRQALERREGRAQDDRRTQRADRRQMLAHGLEPTSASHQLVVDLVDQLAHG